MGGRWLSGASIIFVGLALAGGIPAVLYLAVEDTQRVENSIGIVLDAATLLAIIVGGFFAVYKLQIFRDFEPHLTVSHVVNHRRIGDRYVHIDVTVTLRNGSRVRVDVQEGFFLLQQIAPAGDEGEQNLIDQFLRDEGTQDFQWPTLDEGSFTWGSDGVVIEPGETRQELSEFFVPVDVNTVSICTYYYDSRRSRASQGWGATTVYDIMDA